MATAKIFNIFCAVDQAVLTTSDSFPLKRMFEEPIFGDSVIFRFTLFENLGSITGYDIDAEAQLEFVAANTVAATASDIAIYAHNAKFSTANWSVFSRINGKVACDINLNSTVLKTLLVGESSISLKAELIMVPPGTTVHITLCQFDIVIKNTLYSNGLDADFTIDLVPGALESSSSSSSSSSTSSVNSSSCSTSSVNSSSSPSSSLNSSSCSTSSVNSSSSLNSSSSTDSTMTSSSCSTSASSSSTSSSLNSSSSSSP